mgnify:FL=1
MRKQRPDFLRGARNVYRTRFYIVKQELMISANDVETCEMYSRDTYYLRTTKRDKEYEYIFAARKHIDGKRLPSTMYTRKYVD